MQTRFPLPPLTRLVKKAAIGTVLFGWPSLGFYRGWKKEQSQLYTVKFYNAMLFTGIYVFPLTMPFIVFDELCNLEKTIRKL